MTEIPLATASGAAQNLITRLNGPPQSHAVWIKTEVGPDGEFVRCICVSEHPKFKGKLNIPKIHLGVPVEQVPWPKEMV